MEYSTEAKIQNTSSI